jgi:hypothetical protein
MPQEPARKNPRWPAIGIALFVIGLLIVVPSGLCTALGMAVVLSQGMGDISMLGVVLTFGGVPMALGAVLVYAGWKSRRRD